MKFIKFAAVAVTLALSACATKHSAVDTVDNAYVTRLNARLVQYNQAANGIDSSLNTSAQPATGDEPPSSPQEILDQIKRGAELRGRAFILDRFMKEAAASGGLGFMYSWLQNQAAEQAHLSSDTDTKVTMFQKDASSSPNSPQIMDRFFRLVVERGAEQGIAEELQAIFNDVRGYERDYAGAAMADRKREEDAERELQAYLSAPRVNVEAPTHVQMAVPAAPRLTTCLPNIFGSLNCFSN